ncbi:MAG: TIGR04282 family arsenosugar biosynthesis glycosyltransferase [Ktedonobacterales bacterium]
MSDYPTSPHRRPERDFSPDPSRASGIHACDLLSHRAPGSQTRDLPDALVIVAKYPEPGAVKTRLGATIGHERAANLYRAFLADLAARFGAANGYRLHWAVAPGAHSIGALQTVFGPGARLFAQRGDDFAVRLYSIVEDMRDAGYRRVAILSSDAPQLPTWLVTDAFAALATGDVALAPAEDGGYSLIALHLERATGAAPPDLFRGIHMSTPTVLAETLQRAASLGLSTTLLPTSFDVDEASDLARLWAALADDATLAPQTYAALAELLPAMTAQAGGQTLAHGDCGDWRLASG